MSDADERARSRVHELVTTMNVSLPGLVLGFCLLFLGGCNVVDRGSVASRGKEAPTDSTGGEASPHTARPGTHLDPPSGEIVRIRLIDPDAQPSEVAAGPDGATDDPGKIASKPERPSSADPSVVEMEAFRVSGKTYLSFDFGLSFVRNGEKISWATITAVKPNSEASAAGLRPMARILAINGRDIEDYEASFRHGSELNALLIDRKPGAKITLEVLLDGYSQRKTVTLVRRMSNLRLDPDDILRAP